MSGIGYFGCKPDPIDHRDWMKMYAMVPSSLQYPSVDLRKYVTGIYNQGQLNSCTANAACGAYRMDVNKESLPVFNPSRLFLYYNTREMEDCVSENKGVYIRDTIKSIASVGVCKEKIWPYVAKEFAECPPQEAYMEARGNIISEYERLYVDIDQFRACLQDNCPFVFGFKIFNGFGETNNPRGIMPMPGPNETWNGKDAHAVVAVGYDDRSRYFTILNSWGENWADKGYFYMPYDFISDPSWCFSFWKITWAKERQEQ